MVSAEYSLCTMCSCLHLSYDKRKLTLTTLATGAIVINTSLRQTRQTLPLITFSLSLESVYTTLFLHSQSPLGSCLFSSFGAL